MESSLREVMVTFMVKAGQRLYMSVFWRCLILWIAMLILAMFTFRNAVKGKEATVQVMARARKVAKCRKGILEMPIESKKAVKHKKNAMEVVT